MVRMRGRAVREAAGRVGLELAREACRCVPVHEHNTRVQDKNIYDGQGTKGPLQYWNSSCADLLYERFPWFMIDRTCYAIKFINANPRSLGRPNFKVKS